MVKVKEFIARMGIKSQEELAERLNIKPSAVYSWTIGKRTPTYEMCVALLELGMTVEELFGKSYPSCARKTVLELDETSKEALRRLVLNIGI